MTTTPKDHRAVIKQLVEATDIAAPYFTHNALFAQALTAGRAALGADDSGFVINNTRSQVSSAQLHQLKEALAAGRDGPVSTPPELDDPDRELVLKVKIALHSYSDGAPLRDELSESDIADALSLLIRCLPPGDAQEADIKFRAWYLDCCGKQMPQTPVSKT